MMFNRLLIANRGEVAVRVARAAREIGIAPYGVVSSADADASWLSALDGHVCIGGSAPKESYLRADAVVQAARQTGCAAVHPGWGFLAENPRFAALCEQHGLTFIGPRPGVMERMGRKWPAKVAMRAAGLAPIPGSEGLLDDVEAALAAAEDVGYPIILKADAGGGGRGMRMCTDARELREAFGAARAESLAAFGSGALYLERYLEGGRHIEVQILADAFGAAVHLGERDCSVQRNHQKLIEESPSPALDADERAALGELAASAAVQVGYAGAGTIEFLRDDTSGTLYFMEMNTRLQVEHPVSEAVTGIDIVLAQLRSAANQALGLTQDDVAVRGHAIECRINAEDPAQGFRPTPGRLATFEFAADVDPGAVRIDTHLQAGDEVSPYYDSLLAKVIAWGETREAAIATMRGALAASRVEGVATTLPLHLAVLDSPEFKSGEYDTRSIPGWPT
ncbi:MAG: ATP-grasp domain-containing protein [bacterium]|nr:ATP-grasp domain-containing protein [bacterium]